MSAYPAYSVLTYPGQYQHKTSTLPYDGGDDGGDSGGDGGDGGGDGGDVHLHSVLNLRKKSHTADIRNVSYDCAV